MEYAAAPAAQRKAIIKVSGIDVTAINMTTSKQTDSLPSAIPFL